MSEFVPEGATHKRIYIGTYFRANPTGGQALKFGAARDWHWLGGWQ